MCSTAPPVFSKLIGQTNVPRSCVCVCVCVCVCACVCVSAVRGGGSGGIGVGSRVRGERGRDMGGSVTTINSYMYVCGIFLC